MVTLLLLMVLAALFEPFGAAAALGVFASSMLVLVARVRIWIAVPAAAAAIVVTLLFFGQALGVPLPSGTFWG